MGECVVCAGELTPHRRYEFKSSEFRRVYSGSKVFRCTACTLSQVDMPKVDDALLSKYYADEYRVVASAGSASEVTKSFWRQRAHALTLLAKDNLASEPSRIFEVGAGYGVNLMTLKSAYPGAQLFTDEPSQVAERDPCIVTAGLSEGPYDLVIMSHVLEHFTDPKGLLDSVRDNLTSGGVAIIEVPNDIDGIERYNGPDEPHLTFFETPSLTALLDKLDGFEVVDVFTAGPTVVRDSFKRRVRKFAGRIAYAAPILGSRLTKRAVGNVGQADWVSKNPNGVFLRAVLRKH